METIDNAMRIAARRAREENQKVHVYEHTELKECTDERFYVSAHEKYHPYRYKATFVPEPEIKFEHPGDKGECTECNGTGTYTEWENGYRHILCLHCGGTGKR